MIKFKSVAYPKPSEGVSYKDVVDQVVPDDSMSLQEILERFTRREELPIGRPHSFGNPEVERVLDVDLEKVQFADLTEKEEFRQTVAKVRETYNKQMAEKAANDKKKAAEAAKAAEEKRIRLAARRLAKEKGSA